MVIFHSNVSHYQRAKRAAKKQHESDAAGGDPWANGLGVRPVEPDPPGGFGTQVPLEIGKCFGDFNISGEIFN